MKNEITANNVIRLIYFSYYFIVKSAAINDLNSFL
jgi:hypothetical protein